MRVLTALALLVAIAACGDRKERQRSVRSIPALRPGSARHHYRHQRHDGAGGHDQEGRRHEAGTRLRSSHLPGRVAHAVIRPPAPAKPAPGRLSRRDSSRKADRPHRALTTHSRPQLLLFGRNFIKHPRMLGSLIPSSRFLVNHVLAEVDWARARVFLEYGPGVGTFTTEILRRMRPDAQLVAMETNTDFVRFLRRRVQRSAGSM